MDRFVKFVLGDAWHYAKDAGWLFVLALCLPVWQIIASFGHHTVEVPVLGSMFFWKLLIIAALGIGYLAWKRARTPGLFLTLCILLIAATGKSADTQAIGPVITLFFTDLMLVGLGVFLWTGTLFGYALSPGQQTTIAAGLQPARQNFQSFMIFAFWLNLTAFATARAGHLLPVWFTLTMLSVALIMVPGALAIFGHGAFAVMLRLTGIAFIISIGLGMLMAFQQLSIIGPWDELSKTFRTFLWDITDIETYYLPWGVAIFLAIFVKFIMKEWTAKKEKTNVGLPPRYEPVLDTAMIVTTICHAVFAALPIALVVWLFGVRNGFYRIRRYFLPYIAFPLEMPMIYTPNQGIFVVLSALSMLLLLYKAMRGGATELSWGGAFFLIILLWVGIFGGKAIFYRLG